MDKGHAAAAAMLALVLGYLVFGWSTHVPDVHYRAYDNETCLEEPGFFDVMGRAIVTAIVGLPQEAVETHEEKTSGLQMFLLLVAAPLVVLFITAFFYKRRSHVQQRENQELGVSVRKLQAKSASDEKRLDEVSKAKEAAVKRADQYANILTSIGKVEGDDAEGGSALAQLRLQIQKVVEEIESNREFIEDLQKENTKLSTQLTSANSDSQALLTAQLDEKETTLGVLREELEEAQQQQYQDKRIGEVKRQQLESDLASARIETETVSEKLTVITRQYELLQTAERENSERVSEVRISELETKLEEKEQQLKTHEEQREQLRTTVNTYEADTAALQEEVQALRQGNDAAVPVTPLKEHIVQLEAEVRQLKQDRDTAAPVTPLKEHVVHLEAEVRQLKQDRDTAAPVTPLKEHIVHLEAEVQQLKQEKDATPVTPLKKRVVHLEAELRDLKEQEVESVATYRAEVSAYKTELGATKEEAAEHKRENSTLERELRRVKEILQERDEEMADTSGDSKLRIRELENEADNALVELQVLKEDFAEKEKEVAALQEQLEESKAGQSNANVLLEEKEQQATESIKQLEVEKEELQRATEAEKCTAKAEREEKVRVVEEFETTINGLREEIYQLRESRQTSDEAEELRERCQALEEELKEHKDNMKQLEAEHAESKLKHTENSASAKVALNERSIELNNVIADNSKLQEALEQSQTLLQASEEREAGLESRLSEVTDEVNQSEAALQTSVSGTHKLEARCAELAREVDDLQDTLERERVVHDESRGTLLRDAEQLKEELSRVSSMTEEATYKATHQAERGRESMVRIMQLEKELREANAARDELTRANDGLVGDLKRKERELQVADDLCTQLKDAGAEQQKLKQELYGRDTELEKRVCGYRLPSHSTQAHDVNKLSDYKGELENALKLTASKLEVEKNKSKGVNEELKKLTQKLNVLQTNSPARSPRSVRRPSPNGVHASEGSSRPLIMEPHTPPRIGGYK